MGRSALVLAVMLGAPALLVYASALTGAASHPLPVVGLMTLVAAWALGMAALAFSGWPRRVRIGVAIAYTAAAIPGLPLLALLAVCTTGDCL